MDNHNQTKKDKDDSLIAEKLRLAVLEMGEHGVNSRTIHMFTTTAAKVEVKPENQELVLMADQAIESIKFSANETQKRKLFRLLQQENAQLVEFHDNSHVRVPNKLFYS